jgi:hypothetical protein
MNRVAVRSEALGEVGYDPQSLTLEVQFKDGRVYQYFDVPAQIYEELLNPPGGSKGAYFAYNIKGVYRYERL